MQPQDVTNPEKLVPLRLRSKVAVNGLINALGQHPEYWLAAWRVPDESILTAQVGEGIDFDTCAAAEQPLLEAKYGAVSREELSTPQRGVRFSFTSGELELRLTAFERRSGIALFTVAGRPEFSNGWNEAVASFADGGG